MERSNTKAFRNCMKLHLDAFGDVQGDRIPFSREEETNECNDATWGWKMIACHVIASVEKGQVGQA